MAKFLLLCCQTYYQMWQGGNQWSGGCAYLDYWTSEHGIKVGDKDVFSCYRNLALSSGPRIVHRDFVMICDRPRILRVDDQSRPHCDNGPSHEWRDGWRLWYLNGVKVDEQIVMRPESQTVEQIKAEQNAEVKRLRVERFGWPKYLAGIGAQRLDARRNDVEGTREALYRADDMGVLVCACPSTGRVYSLECPPEVRTCEQAQNYLSSGLAPRIISAA